MKVFTWPYNDTALSPAGSHGITLPVPNFTADFRVKSNGTDSVTLTNLTTPLGLDETVRFAINNVNDVYAGTSVDRALHAPTKRGKGILVSIHDVAKVTDTTDATFEMALPFKANLTVQFLNHELVDSTVLEVFISRLIAMLYETSDTSMKPRLSKLIRAALKPDGI